MALTNIVKFLHKFINSPIKLAKHHLILSPVVKLSRNVAERRSGTFLKAGMAFRDFYAGQRRNETRENGTYFSTAFRQMRRQSLSFSRQAPAVGLKQSNCIVVCR